MPKAHSQVTDEELDRMRELFEAGNSIEEIAKQTGRGSSTIVRYAGLRGWQRPAYDVAGDMARRQAQTANARAAAEARWSLRRAEEADRAGLSAAIARQRVLDALDANDHNMTRAAVIAYGVFIDKAQLLSGGATGRTEAVENLNRDQIDERARELDELARRRAERTA